MSPEPLNVDALFVRSAAGADDLPRDGLAEIAMVGRSNVGKSSLINALLRRKIARTSGTPGKTRLANIYRVSRDAPKRPPFYLVDLPGYGYAKGQDSASALAAIADAYFGRVEGSLVRRALLLVDSRHPGLASDVEAWTWLSAVTDRCHVVATKIDKLARGQRRSALRELESVHEGPVLPVSAVTGEGLDELWILIDRLANNSSRRQPRT